MKLGLDLSSLIKNKNVVRSTFFGGIVLIVILDLIIFFPLVGMINQSKSEQKAIVQKIESAKKLLAAQGNRKAMQLLSIEGIDQVIDDISQLADKESIELTFKSTTPADKPGKPKDPYSLKTLSANATGAFKNLGQFLSSVKDMPGVIIDTEEINIVRSAKNYFDLQAQIKFVFYMVKKND